jgi:hypothetical protein
MNGRKPCASSLPVHQLMTPVRMSMSKAIVCKNMTMATIVSVSRLSLFFIGLPIANGFKWIVGAIKPLQRVVIRSS